MKKNVHQNQDPTHKMIDNILLSFKRSNIYVLVIGPIVISLLLLGMLLMAGNRIYGEQVPEIYQTASGVIFLVVLSFSGFIQIYRREGPGPLGYPVFGIWPVISGCIIAIICWASIIYLIFHMFKLMST